MKKITLFTIIFILNIAKIKTMYFFVNNGETECITQKKFIDENFRIIYYISGAKEEGNKITINSPSGKKLWEGTQKKHDKLTFKTHEEGYYQFCVNNKSNGKLTITFEFPEEIKESQVLSVKNIKNFATAIDNILKKLNNIQFNIRNSAVRRIKHNQVTLEIMSKISLYTTLKIVFLILFSAFQICMVMSIFKDVKVVDKISINTSETSSLKSGKNTPDENFIL
jgi:hypothetical protein